jgi:hypothetical protein
MLIAMIAVFLAMRNRSGRLSCVRGRGRGCRRRLTPLPLRLEPNLFLLLLVPLQLLQPLLVMALLTRARGIGRVRITRGDKEDEVDATIKGADALQVLDNVGLRRAERNQNLMDTIRITGTSENAKSHNPISTQSNTGEKFQHWLS